MRNGIPKVERSLLHKGAKFDFEQVRITSRSGKTLEREVVRHPGAVVVVPILEDAGAPALVLIRNWRLSIEAWSWELPAGTLGAAEDPAACAARELTEETGYSAATIEPLCRFHTSPGLSDELMHAFAARGLSFVGQHLEEDERIEVEVVPVSRTLGMIRDAQLTDAKSIVAIWTAANRGLFGPVSL